MQKMLKMQKNVECTKSTKKTLRCQLLVQKKQTKVNQQKYKKIIIALARQLLVLCTC